MGGRLQQSDDPSEERETTEKMVHQTDDKVDFNVMLDVALILFSDIFILKRR